MKLRSQSHKIAFLLETEVEEKKFAHMHGFTAQEWLLKGYIISWGEKNVDINLLIWKYGI